MLLTASQIADLPEQALHHSLNAGAVRHFRALGDVAGLKNLGVHMVRLEAGRESTEFHRHLVEEECIFVLSGSGVAEIGDQAVEVAPGDFMGFAAKGEAHSLNNTGDEDLVYLVFGQRCEFDVCDYPRVGKRLYRLANEERLVPLDGE